jgi:hypothetical protein
MREPRSNGLFVKFRRTGRRVLRAQTEEVFTTLLLAAHAP